MLKRDRRVRRARHPLATCQLLLILTISVGCASASTNSTSDADVLPAAPPASTTTAIPATSVVETTSAATARTGDTTNAEARSPDAEDAFQPAAAQITSLDVLAAYQSARAAGFVTTFSERETGRTAMGEVQERVRVMSTETDGRVSGRTEFTGETSVLGARAAGNRALADVLLSEDGVPFHFDGRHVFVERVLASTLHPDIGAEGSQWVKVETGKLGKTEEFALSLFAPWAHGDFQGLHWDLILERSSQSVDDVGYFAEIDDVSVFATLTNDGHLDRVSVSAYASPVFGYESYRMIFLPDPLDGLGPFPEPGGAEDITATFQDFVANRLAEAPLTLGEQPSLAA